MTRGEPVIEFHGVEKALGDSSPLRIKEFVFRRHDRVVLGGLPGALGESLMHLIVGAALPDEGDVIVFGKNTKEIRTDTEWLHSLDRFGLVSNRAVLLDQSTVAENLALPLTLAIDPMAPDVRRAVEALADEVGLPRAPLDQPVGASNVDRMTLHLARALATSPQVLLVEHPTQQGGANPRAFGARLRGIAVARHLSLLAVSDDDVFQRETGAERLQVARDGTVAAAGFNFRRFWRRS